MRGSTAGRQSWSDQLDAVITELNISKDKYLGCTLLTALVVNTGTGLPTSLDDEVFQSVIGSATSWYDLKYEEKRIFFGKIKEFIFSRDYWKYILFDFKE